MEENPVEKYLRGKEGPVGIHPLLISSDVGGTRLHILLSHTPDSALEKRYEIEIRRKNGSIGISEDLWVGRQEIPKSEELFHGDYLETVWNNFKRVIMERLEKSEFLKLIKELSGADPEDLFWNGNLRFGPVHYPGSAPVERVIVGPTALHKPSPRRIAIVYRPHDLKEMENKLADASFIINLTNLLSRTQERSIEPNEAGRERGISLNVGSVLETLERRFNIRPYEVVVHSNQITNDPSPGERVHKPDHGLKINVVRIRGYSKPSKDRAATLWLEHTPSGRYKLHVILEPWYFLSDKR